MAPPENPFRLGLLGAALLAVILILLAIQEATRGVPTP